MDTALQLVCTRDLWLTFATMHIGIICFAICRGRGKQPHCKPQARFSAPSPYASRQAGRQAGRQAQARNYRQAGRQAVRQVGRQA